ncbi:F1F0 ATP synthase assembly protein-like protein Atp11 [Hortaea werneckii]|uniref:ATP11 domain-containing protein n=1 Tax=Hortaea werneckii TaxID=91943 RepID=A0A3M7G3Z2_HORWE|nr:F1F0 ATP synthase assembly protein-like protein Atp11 [Hortaea werneckii]RMY95845.1 hypothetical protein D0861_00382 [Hortaea werneckii]
MAYVIDTSAPLLRRTAWSIQAPLRVFQNQKRFAQVHDVRYFAAHHRQQAVYDKYKDKLAQKAKQQGYKNVDELKEANADKIRELRKNASVPGANAPLETQAAAPPSPNEAATRIPYQAPPPPTPQSEQPASTSSQAETITSTAKETEEKLPTLSSFLDVEKTAALPQKEIEALWRLRHVRDPQSLCAAMATSTFARLARTARQHPQFILPLPKEGQGAEIHFLQWTFPSETTVTVLFTHLAEFKLRGEFAQPHTTVTHHLDLAESNGVVLMEGRTMENRGVSVEDGKFLLMCLQKFYGFEGLMEGDSGSGGDAVAKQNASQRRKLMEQFTNGDEGFKVEELLEEAEKVP